MSKCWHGSREEFVERNEFADSEESNAVQVEKIAFIIKRFRFSFAGGTRGPLIKYIR